MIVTELVSKMVQGNGVNQYQDSVQDGVQPSLQDSSSNSSNNSSSNGSNNGGDNRVPTSVDVINRCKIILIVIENSGIPIL